MIEPAGQSARVIQIATAIPLFTASCTTAATLGDFKLETTAYRSFPSTARLDQTCVIDTGGISEFSQDNRTERVSFDPRSALREGLVYGLQQTCLRTLASPRAGDADALDLAGEIGVVAEVTTVSLRRGPYDGGKDEVEIVASVTLHRAGAPPLTGAVEGRSAQLASFYDIKSAIALAIVDTVDGVNQLIFDNRASLHSAP